MLDQALANHIEDSTIQPGKHEEIILQVNNSNKTAIIHFLLLLFQVSKYCVTLLCKGLLLAEDILLLHF